MREVVFRNVSCERREIGSKIVETVDDDVGGGCFVEGGSAPVSAEVTVLTLFFEETNALVEDGVLVPICVVDGHQEPFDGMKDCFKGFIRFEAMLVEVWGRIVVLVNQGVEEHRVKETEGSEVDGGMQWQLREGAGGYHGED